MAPSTSSLQSVRSASVSHGAGSRISQACRPCQRRKKKCNGAFPRCDLCAKYDDDCEYGPPSQDCDTSTNTPLPHFRRDASSVELGRYGPPASLPARSGFDFAQVDAIFGLPMDLPSLDSVDSASHPMAPNGIDFDQTATFIEHDVLPTSLSGDNAFPQASYDRLSIPTPESPRDAMALHRAAWLGHSSPPLDSRASGPSKSSLNDRCASLDIQRLVALFFDRFHCVLPTFHVASFMNEVDVNSFNVHQSPALGAVLAFMCGQHQETSIRNAEMSNTLLSALVADLSRACLDKTANLRSLQALVWMALLAHLHGDANKSWTIMNRAWAVACCLGYNFLDDPDLGDDIEREKRRYREEIRKTMWALFVLDRGLYCLTSRPQVIEDSCFVVGLPLKDDVFQRTSSPALMRDPFKAARLPNLEEPSPDAEACVFEAYKLLGNVRQATVYRAASDEQRQQLKSTLGYFRIATSKHATNAETSSSCGTTKYLWLSVILDSASAMLSYDELYGRTCGGQRGDPQLLTLQGCLAAASRPFTLAADVLATSLGPLQNPHLAPLFFICSQILLHRESVTSPNGRRQSGSARALSLMDRLGTIQGAGWRLYADAASQILACGAEDGERSTVGIRTLAGCCTNFLF